MPFRIFASGHGASGHFVHERVDLDFEKAVDKAAQIQAVAEGNYGSVQGVAKTANDVRNAGPDDVGAGAQKVGQIVMAELIQTGINYLAMKGGGDRRKVMLSARMTHALWPDTMRVFEVSLDEDDAGYSFMKKLKTALVATDMYTVGVLRHISDTLARYGTWMDARGGDPWLSIQLKG
ncbi:hypothetical protein [Sphingomonas sp.]|uniref:hypothetical protein n=1 Tax=Sphingomonas sp. TaxID=28214 RepID=UPI003CC58CAC